MEEEESEMQPLLQESKVDESALQEIIVKTDESATTLATMQAQVRDSEEALNQLLEEMQEEGYKVDINALRDCINDYLLAGVDYIHMWETLNKQLRVGIQAVTGRSGNREDLERNFGRVAAIYHKDLTGAEEKFKASTQAAIEKVGEIRQDGKCIETCDLVRRVMVVIYAFATCTLIMASIVVLAPKLIFEINI